MLPILEETQHLPWPLPDRPWVMFMRWTALAFLHWPVRAALLRPLLPPELELDEFDGHAWVGVVPFRMERTRARCMPRIPTASTFPETNVRTYVRANGKAGVWFFSLDAASWLAVRGARTMFNLTYHHASMEIRERGDEVAYSSRRTRTADDSAALETSYRPIGPTFRSTAGSIDEWLTERYCLFGRSRRGRVYSMEIHHLPWPLQRGEAELRKNTLARAAGIALPDIAPIVHFARSLDVVAWLPTSIET